ncbi:conjugal transfer protein TraT [Escherichia coli]|nr:conjugal transfer protein TraT [Escherichia coli]
MKKTPPLIAPVRERWLYPLPQPDTVFSGEALLPPPVLSTEGRCPCCRRTVTHRFILEDSWPLQQMADTCRDTVVLLEKKPHPDDAPEKNVRYRKTMTKKKKHTRTLQDAERSLAQARLSARRLALRHVEKSQIVTTNALSENESDLLQPEGPPFHLCAFCHAWHCLNGYAAAQGVMVWLPDLHPASVVALNARALQAIFSDNRQRVRQGRAVLNALVQNRLAVEEKFRTWRPADFADALRRWPPAQRKTLREKMDGVALILLPDSFPDKKYVM